jgi:guanylate kinase
MEQNNFDSELQTYFTEIKNKIKQEHVSYIKSHAELRQILNDFLSSILLEQPSNVYNYAQQYFTFFNHQKDQKTYRPLVISGCSGAGKVLNHPYSGNNHSGAAHALSKHF